MCTFTVFTLYCNIFSFFICIRYLHMSSSLSLHISYCPCFSFISNSPLLHGTRSTIRTRFLQSSCFPSVFHGTNTHYQILQSEYFEKHYNTLLYYFFSQEIISGKLLLLLPFLSTATTTTITVIIVIIIILFFLFYFTPLPCKIFVEYREKMKRSLHLIIAMYDSIILVLCSVYASILFFQTTRPSTMPRCHSMSKERNICLVIKHYNSFV
jgi:hypothetical protein